MVARKAEMTTATGDGTARYPFYDLDNCIEVARALHVRGGGTLTVDQLVPATGHKGRSGSFLTKLASARLFGLITSSAGVGRVGITDRGNEIVAPTYPGTSDRQAKADAFLAVPLFGAVYRHFSNKQLPPKEGLENSLRRDFGVPQSQVAFAWRSLKSSAATAGFLEATNGEFSRLVRPVIGQATGGQSKIRPSDEEPTALARESGAISAPRAVRGAVDMLPGEGSRITTAKLNGLVEAYRTALLMSYEIVSDEGDLK